MLASFAQAAVSGTNYRLAGIVAAGSGSAIALIELPDGRQRFFRTGDSLGSGTIREITPAAVRVELAQEHLLLRLRGAPTLLTDSRAEASSEGDAPSGDAVQPDEVVSSGDEAGGTEEQTVNDLQLGASEAEGLVSAARRASDPGPGETPLSPESLREQLDSLLEVPSGAQIVAVDDVPVQTPQEVIRALVARLHESSTARLSVNGAGALRTIVVNSDTEQ